MRARSPGNLVAEPATAEGPPRRRSSWNLRTIVEDVAGRPIEELQDPERPPHPYLKARPPVAAPVVRARAEPSEEYDPVGHVYPPFVGAAGRAYHGADHEHDRATLERHHAPEGGRSPGPSHRPERLYLHYLLLHMDRLNDTSLRYLRAAVEEEMEHRSRPTPSTPPPVAPTTAPPLPALDAPPPA